jgi:hypothetical protein
MSLRGKKARRKALFLEFKIEKSRVGAEWLRFKKEPAVFYR